MPTVIRVGRRVSGAVGELYFPPSAGENGKKKRRVRKRKDGTVVSSEPNRQWKVLWDDGTESTHPSNVLKDEGRDHAVSTRAGPTSASALPSAAASTNERTPSSATLGGRTSGSVPSNENSLRSQGSMPSLGQSSQSSMPSLHPVRHRANGTNDDSTVSSDESSIARADGQQEEDLSSNEDEHWMYNEQDREALQRAQEFNERVIRAGQEKQSLIGTEIEVGPAQGDKVAWCVRHDVTESEVDEDVEEYDVLGTRGLLFQCEKLTDLRSSLRKGGKRRRTVKKERAMKFLPILQHMWPGNWREHLQKLNEKIRSVNNEANRRRTNGVGQRQGSRVIREVSEHEFWVFIGIILAAVGRGAGGTVMWDKDDPDDLFNIKSMDPCMKQYRFGDTKKYWPYIFHDSSREGTDEWWQIIKLIEDFNENRSSTVAASIMKIIDESMSAFCPQVHKDGNVPHLSFIQRKPEPLGIEFKVVCCIVTGLILHLELQRGKEQMRRQPHSNTYGATAGCTLRLAEGAKSCGQATDTEEDREREAGVRAHSGGNNAEEGTSSETAGDAEGAAADDTATAEREVGDVTCSGDGAAEEGSSNVVETAGGAGRAGGDGTGTFERGADGEGTSSVAETAGDTEGVAADGTATATAEGEGGARAQPAQWLAGQRRRRRRRKEVFMGDSWFCGVKAAAAMMKLKRCHFIGLVKTNHSMYPKRFLNEKMKSWPAGTHLVMEGRYDGIDLIAVGYKYSNKKVQLFLMTKGAAATTEGEPYEAKWRDDSRRFKSRNIFRPKMASLFFGNSNKIDSHNHARQFELALEKLWVTEDGYFRVWTTILGMCVTDAWKAYTRPMPAEHQDSGITVKKYCGILAKECLENGYSDSVGGVVYVPRLASSDQPSDAEDRTSSSSPGNLSSVSSITASLAAEAAGDPHSRMKLYKQGTTEEKVGKGKEKTTSRTSRGRCAVCGAKTRFRCSVCHAGVCEDGSGRPPAKRMCETAHKEDERKAWLAGGGQSSQST